MNSMQQQPGDPGNDDARQHHTRILHPVRRRENWRRTAPDGEIVRRVCVLDTETTGLAVDRHQIIELCAAIVLVNAAGRIAAVQCVKNGLVDPGHPLSAEIAELTGLSDSDLAGHSISGDELTALIEYCDGVVAFNAAFDRPFVEKLLSKHVPVQWGCAMADVPWRQLGFEPGPQGYLAMQAGRFMPSAHRAQDDVLALIELLDHVCADGESVMAKTLSAMTADAWRFEAKGAPFRYKDDLRERRYRFAWERTHKRWHKHVRLSSYQEELDWYRRTIGQEPAIVPLPATERYRADSTWKPA